MLERVLGPPTDPAPLVQEGSHPGGREAHPRLLLQVGRQPRRGPDVEDQPQRGRRGLHRRLQRLEHRRGGLGRPAAARRIRQRPQPLANKLPQPAPHRALTPSAPGPNGPQVLAERRRLDHLQALTLARGQVRPAQPSLQLLALLLPQHDPSYCLFSWRHVVLLTAYRAFSDMARELTRTYLALVGQLWHETCRGGKENERCTWGHDTERCGHANSPQGHPAYH